MPAGRDAGRVLAVRRKPRACVTRSPCRRWKPAACRASSTSRSPGCSAGCRASRDATLRAVDEVSFAIRAGTTLSLVGESGCGKSTIARLAVGLYAPTAGEIRFEGQNAVGGPRAAGAAAADEHDLPGPVRLAQSALAGARHRRRADPRLFDPARRARHRRAGRRVAGAGRPGAGGRRAVPARIQRRPAPAHLHRARAVERAGVPGVRRADQRAGRFGAGADSQPDARCRSGWG